MEEPPTSSVMLIPEPIRISSNPQDIIEISQPVEDEWIPQNGGDDFTSELLEAVEKGQNNMNAHDEKMQTRTIMPKEGLTESPSDRVSEQIPSKPVIFTRPASSHEDLASGFSFTKPKPVQPLNLSIKTKQTTPPAMSEAAKAPTPESLTRHVPRMSLPARDMDPKEDAQATPEAIRKVLCSASNVPFPMPRSSAACDGPQQYVESRDQSQPHATVTRKIQYPQSSDDALVDSSAETLVEPIFTADNIQNSDHQPRGHTQTVKWTSRLDVSNVGHPRPLKKKRGTHGSRADAKMLSWMKGGEDAIHMLMFHRKKQQETFDSMLATQQAQNERIIDLEDLEASLNAELREVRKRLEEKEAESKEFQALKPKLQARLTKFKDFLNGLSDDHTRLRTVGCKILDDTQQLRSEHQESKIELEGTKPALNMTQEAIKRERALWMKELIGGDCQVKMLEQALKNLQAQLQQEQTVAYDERARSERLEQSITQASGDHERLMSAFADHHNKIAKTISELLDRPSQPISSDSPIFDTTPMLKESIELLEVLRARQTVQPADLRQLEASVKEHTKLVLDSVQSFENNIVEKMTFSQQIARQMDDSVKKELQELTGVLAGDQPRREQVMELRERKAIVQESLHATEASLREARLEVAVLRTREQENCHRIASLETQASQVRSEPAAAPEIYLRLHHLETSNKELEEQRSKIQTEVSTLSDKLQQKESDFASANSQLAALELQVEEAHSKNVTMQQEKSFYRKEAAVQREQLRKELSHAANVERANLRGELAIAKKQIRQSQTNTVLPSTYSPEEIEKSMADKTRLEKTLAENTAHLQMAQTELQEERKQKLILGEKVAKLDKENRDTISKQKVKDDEIEALKIALDKTRLSVKTISKQTHARDDPSETAAVKSGSEVKRVERSLTEIVSRSRGEQTPPAIQYWTNEAESNSVGDPLVDVLFDSTPGKPSGVRRDLGTLSSTRANNHQKSTSVPEMRQVEDSQSQKGNSYVFKNHDLSRRTSSKMASYSPSIVPAPQEEWPLDDITARNTASNALGARPNTKVTRKRSATTADLVGLEEPWEPKKATRSSTRINGPVVADSQPARAPSQTNRPTKLSNTDKKGTRSGIYQGTFNRYR